MTLTLVIHGTFAAADKWWRPGQNLCNQLEKELAAKGLPGTVWQPALAQGFAPEDFAWSGDNTHSARVQGGKKLARNLHRLAEKLGASDKDPLEINFVAHSHGGNVVLEALRYLDKTVKPQRVVMLGTPLLRFRPALRLVRLLAAVYFIGLASILSVVLPFLLFYITARLLASLFGWPLDFLDIGPPELYLSPLFILAAIPFYGWYLCAIAFMFDLAWWPFGKIMMAIRRATTGQVYGPSPKALSRLLAGAPVTLMAHHQDEAGLFLHLASAPRLLYQEYVAQRFGRIKRTLEFILVRPCIAHLLLRGFGVVLETYVLGIHWMKTLFFDYAMADLKKGKPYAPHVLQVEEVDHLIDSSLLKKVNLRRLRLTPTSTPRLSVSGKRRTLGVLITLRRMMRFLVGQVSLRHSLYYSNAKIIQRIADRIAS